MKNITGHGKQFCGEYRCKGGCGKDKKSVTHARGNIEEPTFTKAKKEIDKKNSFENLMDTIFSRPTVVKGLDPAQEIMENQSKLKARFPLASKLGISGLPGRVITRGSNESTEEYDNRLQDRIFEIGVKLDEAIPKMEVVPVDYYDELFRKENLKKYALNEEELHQFIATRTDRASEIEDLARSPYPNVRLVAISRGSLSKETLTKMMKQDSDLVVREKAFLELQGNIISNMNPDSYPVSLKK